jgi:hypothetical protein
MMSLYRFKVAQFSLLALFGIVTVLQLSSFPGQFAHMRRVNGLSLLIEVLRRFRLVPRLQQLPLQPIW